MKLTRCLICGSDKTYEIYPENIDIKKLSFAYVKTPDSNKTFRVIRCKECSHVFCSPIPKNIYKNYEDVVDQEYLNYITSLETSSRLVLPVIKKYVSSGRLLDVGCATGVFLNIARELGFTVEGLELSKWSSDIAQKKGLTIHKKLLKDLSRQYAARYDVITLWGVIEHFENPVEEINFIKKLLKPGGLLVVWTGDVESISSRVLGKKWWYWQGQHIQYFSHKSLNYLGKVCGFKHLDTKTYPFVATYGLMNNYLGRYYFRPWLMRLVKPLFILKPVWILRLPGEMLWIASKKS